MASGWLTLRQAAAYCGCSVKTMRRHLADAARPAPGYKVGHAWRFHPEDLDTWLRSFPRNGADLEAVVEGVREELVLPRGRH